MDVSVIIPVYNVELYLQECLDSVLSQSGCSFEVICIDDGSTDASPKILQEAAQKDPRIRIITQENKGQGYARNRGLDIASGRYVYFMDADDILKADAFVTLIDLCDSKHLDHVIFGTEVFVDDRNGAVRKDQVRNTENYYQIKDKELFHLILNGEDLFKRLLGASSFYVSPPLRFIKRDVLEQDCLRFLEGVIHEDNYFAPLALICAERAMVIPEKYYFRRLRGGSTMTSAKAYVRHTAGCLAVAVKLKTVFGEMASEELAQDSVLESYFRELLDIGSFYFSQIDLPDPGLELMNELKCVCTPDELQTIRCLLLPLLNLVKCANARAQKYREKRLSSRVKRLFLLKKK